MVGGEPEPTRIPTDKSRYQAATRYALHDTQDALRERTEGLVSGEVSPDGSALGGDPCGTLLVIASQGLIQRVVFYDSRKLITISWLVSGWSVM